MLILLPRPTFPKTLFAPNWSSSMSPRKSHAVNQCRVLFASLPSPTDFRTQPLGHAWLSELLPELWTKVTVKQHMQACTDSSAHTLLHSTDVDVTCI